MHVLYMYRHALERADRRRQFESKAPEFVFVLLCLGGRVWLAGRVRVPRGTRPFLERRSLSLRIQSCENRRLFELRVQRTHIYTRIGPISGAASRGIAIVRRRRRRLLSSYISWRGCLAAHRLRGILNNHEARRSNATRSPEYITASLCHPHTAPLTLSTPFSEHCRISNTAAFPETTPHRLCRLLVLSSR